MDYLIQQIFWCLLAAFLLGALVGWLLCHWGGSKKIAELEAKLAPGTVE